MSKKLMPGAKPFFYERGKVGCLLCHGYTGTPDEVHGIGKFLAEKGITTIAPLLPGHGTTLDELIKTNTDDWLKEYSYAFNWLKEYCEEFFVCGLSLGGALTLRFAIENEVNGIISMATPAKFKFHQGFLLSLMAPILRNFAIKKSKEELKGQEKYNIICYDKYPIWPANSIRKLVKRNRFQLKDITDPILIILGLLDEKWLKESAKIIYDRVSSKDKELVFLEKSPHSLTHGSDKELVNEIVYNFIKKNSKLIDFQ